MADSKLRSGKSGLNPSSTLICQSCASALLKFQKPKPGQHEQAAKGQRRIKTKSEKPLSEVSSRRALDTILRTRDRVFVLFYAAWCPFCIIFLPIFQHQVDMNPELFVSVRDDRETLSDPYGVEVFPTILFFEKGAPVKRLDGKLGVGLRSKDFTRFVSSCI
jgi:thiol-disulfide isomerase/thioredoxin